MFSAVPWDAVRPHASFLPQFGQLWLLQRLSSACQAPEQISSKVTVVSALLMAQPVLKKLLKQLILVFAVSLFQATLGNLHLS